MKSTLRCYTARFLFKFIVSRLVPLSQSDCREKNGEQFSSEGHCCKGSGISKPIKAKLDLVRRRAECHSCTPAMVNHRSYIRPRTQNQGLHLPDRRAVYFRNYAEGCIPSYQFRNREMPRMRIQLGIEGREIHTTCRAYGNLGQVPRLRGGDGRFRSPPLCECSRSATQVSTRQTSRCRGPQNSGVFLYHCGRAATPELSR